MPDTEDTVPVATIIKHGRRGTGKKEPLKESNYEQYLRIQRENQEKEAKRNKRAIKKLKKEGKVQSLAGFLICKKEEEEDEWMKSKKARPKRSCKRRKSTNDEIPPTDQPPVPNFYTLGDLEESDNDEEDEEQMTALLNFHPFKNGLHKPMTMKTRKRCFKP